MKFIYRFNAMSTPCEVALYAATKAQADSAANAVLEEVMRLERKYSYYRDDSLLSRINRRETKLLDEESKTLFQRAKQYCMATEGTFDVTVAAFKHYHHSRKTLAALEAAKARYMPHTGCDSFSVKKGAVFFKSPITCIDLGGVVKEYAVDKAVAVLKRHKITSALVNFGGDVYALGRKEDGRRFRIAITDPLDTGRRIGSFELENEALTTSASYERRTQIEGREFSHIVGSKHEGAALSVSVISHNCVESGVWSTASMINVALPCRHYRLIVDADGTVQEEGEGGRLRLPE